MNPRTYRIAAMLLLLGGIALRLRLYLRNSSLWWDEAALAVNLIHRSYAQLIGQLDYQQAAPVGFLYASKLVMGLLGDGEMALRLLPFLCAIASLILLHRLAVRLLSGVAVPVAVGVFALSAPVLRYAVDFKPYSVDVLCAVVITTLACNLLEGDATEARTTSLLALSGLGIPMVWLSNAAPFLLAAAGATLFLHYMNRHETRRAAVIVGASALWLLSFAAVYSINLREIAANPYMRQFWSGQVAYASAPEHGAFLPVPHSLSGLKDMLLWLVERPFAVLSDPVGVPFPGVAFVLLAIGTVAYWRETPLHTALLLLPGVFALLVSAADLYPFLDRFLLFFVPALALLIAVGARQVVEVLAPRFRVGAVLIVALLFIDPAAPILRFREKIQRVALRPALEFVAQQRTQDERIYVGYAIKPVLEYYAPRVGLADDDLLIQAGSVFEPASDAKLSTLLADLGRVRDEPVWLVLAYEAGEERTSVLRALRGFGRLSHEGSFRRVDVYHYVPS